MASIDRDISIFYFLIVIGSGFNVSNLRPINLFLRITLKLFFFSEIVMGLGGYYCLEWWG